VTDTGGFVLNFDPNTPELAWVITPGLTTPTARWGACLGRVADCYETNASVAGCIDLIPRCGGPEGGEGCCPSACIAAFQQLHQGGLDEFAAITTAFFADTCVPGH
jgi:hypothetical protein